MTLYKHLTISDDEIVKRYRNKESACSIARDCGVVCGTIINRLERMHEPIRRCTSPVCRVLSKHHKDLKDDPEHLTTEFIIKISRKVIRNGE